MKEDDDDDSEDDNQDNDEREKFCLGKMEDQKFVEEL